MQRLSSCLLGITEVRWATSDFAQARYYNAVHGRFTSVDPLTASATIRNPQTFNRYTYVLNSPYKFTDPLGLLPSSTGADGGCNFECRVTTAIYFGGKLSRADRDLAVFHIRNGSALGYAFLNAAEDAISRQSQSSGQTRGPNDQMTTSANGKAKIMEDEGYSRKFYDDIAGICTVGYGTVWSSGKSCSQITFSQLTKDGDVKTYNGIEGLVFFEALTDEIAEKILRATFENDLAKREAQVKKLIKVPLTQNQFDALLILRYNLEATPRLYRAINSGDQAGIRREWLSANKVRNRRTGKLEESRGLSLRRQREYDLFITR